MIVSNSKPKNKHNVYEQDEIFWTSDLHFHHSDVIKFCDRPFIDVDHMNQTLIHNWNSVIQPEQTIIINGDLALTGSVDKIKELIDALNGIKIQIYGNHCLQNRHDREVISSLFSQSHHQLIIHVNDIDAHQGKQLIFNSHYPTISWPAQSRDSWHTHGHIHSTNDSTKSSMDDITFQLYKQMKLKSYDVGVDNNQYFPVSYPKLKNKIITQTIKQTCHGTR